MNSLEMERWEKKIYLILAMGLLICMLFACKQQKSPVSTNAQINKFITKTYAKDGKKLVDRAIIKKVAKGKYQVKFTVEEAGPAGKTIRSTTSRLVTKKGKKWSWGD